MAHQRDENFTYMSEDSEWILLEEKIYLLPGVLPRDENEYDMPVIGVNSNEKKRQSSIDHTSSFIEEIHKKNSRTAKVTDTSRKKARAPPELISVDEVTMLTNPHGKKLVFSKSSTPLPQRFMHCGDPSQKKPLMTRTPGQILPGSKWPSEKSTNSSSISEFISGDCRGKEDTKKQEKDEGCFQLSPQMYRPVHTTRKSSRSIASGRIPSSSFSHLPPSSSFSGHTVGISTGNFADYGRRKLVNSQSIPFSQQPEFRRESPTPQKPNSAQAQILPAFQWPPIEGETDCMENDLGALRLEENAPCGGKAKKEYENRINSLGTLSTLQGRHLNWYKYSRSTSLTVQPPSKISPPFAASSQSKTISSSVQILPVFQQPGTKKITNHDDDVRQDFMQKLDVKERNDVRDGPLYSCISSTDLAGQSKPFSPMPPKCSELYKREEDEEKTEKPLPEVRVEGCLLWKRRMKNDERQPVFCGAPLKDFIDAERKLRDLNCEDISDQEKA